MKWQKLMSWVIVALLVLPLLILGWHGIVMFFVIYGQLLAFSIGVGVLSYFLLRRKYSDEYDDTAFFAAIGIAFIVLIITGYWGYESAYTDIYHEYGAGAVQLNELPEMNANLTRAVPLPTAENLMVKYFNQPMYAPTHVEISFINGTEVWMGEISPEGLVNSIKRKPEGVIYVPMDDLQVFQLKTKMNYGVGIWVFDRAQWKLKVHNPTGEIGSITPIVISNTVYYIAPIIKYHQKFLHASPYVDHVSVINTKTGEIKDYSLTEAAKKFGPVPVFPEGFALKVARSMSFWKQSAWANIWNHLTKHEKQYRVPDYNYGGNSQPFYVVTKKGGAWFVALEPYGTGNGIVKVVLVYNNGSTAYVDFNMPVTGAEAAIKAVKNALPMYDWSQFDIVEPIPMTVNGKPYWRLVIIPKQSANIQKIALVPITDKSVEPKDIKFFNSIADFKKFIKTGTVPKNPSTPGLPNETELNTTVNKVFTYVVNGTTHFLLDTSNGIIDIPVTCLTPEQIKELFEIKVPSNITLVKEGNCWVPKR